ncbi:MAG: DUF1566 domain-containing protein, partial [Myxococcota bacterium]|nr:DUF1566 domain-containing protein [Myxococcota bacterium]
AGNSSNAWYIFFRDGFVNDDDKSTGQRVRCVRSGPFVSRRFESMTRSGDRVVRDNVNNLEWQGCTAGLSGADCTAGATETYTWIKALAYCEGLSFGGHLDWRLPSRAELQSIVDQRRVNPSIDPAMFPATPNDYFWSSSTYVNVTIYAWCVDFYDGGSVDDDLKGLDYRVRCVRGGP